MCLRYPKPMPHLLTKQAKRAQREQALRTMRAEARTRAGGRCEVCGHVGAETHHIIPRSRGGSDTAGNAAFLCKSCHQHVTGHLVHIMGRTTDGRLDWERIA